MKIFSLKFKNFKLLFFVVLFFSRLSFALIGDEKGNGGNGFLCENDKIVLLDFYEAKNIRGLNINLGSQNLDFKAKVILVLKRLERLNPSRAHLYLSWFESFFDELRFVNQLAEIPDSGVTEIPLGCKVVQLAAQNSPSLPGDRRYLINQKYWSLLTEDEKAGLIIHELITRELGIEQEYKHSSSKYIRYFNEYLCSDKFESITYREFVNFSTLVKINKIETMDGIPFYVTNSEGDFEKFIFESDTKNSLSYAKIVTDTEFVLDIFKSSIVAVATAETQATYNGANYFINGIPDQFLITKANINYNLDNGHIEIKVGNEHSAMDSIYFAQNDVYQHNIIFTPASWAGPGSNPVICNETVKKSYQQMKIFVTGKYGKKQCGCLMEINTLSNKIEKCE